MRWIITLRVVMIALLVCVGGDLITPSHPGVFSFERAHLFLEEAVERPADRASAAQPALPSTPDAWMKPPPSLVPVARVAMAAARAEMGFRRPSVVIRRKTPSSSPLSDAD